MFDSHCHLTHPRIAPEADRIVDRAREAGLEGCLTIGTGVEDGRLCLALATRHPGMVHCSVGIDPFTAHREADRFDDELALLRELLEGGKFRAVGEVGLDYHYDLGSPRLQAARFEPQLELAAGFDLPVVIHVREAHDDMAAILRHHRTCRGVIHSFTAGPAEATAYLELGWSLGFNGVVTFRNAEAVRDAARETPADRVLVETDSPYLAPVPLRGKRCEPAFVTHTVQRLAEVRGESVVEVATGTTANARRMFLEPRC